MINVLVFPAGTEIGLEIYNSLCNIKDIQLFGANENLPNHGEFIYKDFYGNIDSVYKLNSAWIDQLLKIVKDNSIDVIYPASDDIVVLLSENINLFGNCKIVAPKLEIANIVRSKLLTYSALNGIVHVPKVMSTDDDFNFPVFLKPEKGAGAVNSFKTESLDELNFYINKYKDLFISEYLPGDEFTIDCFSSRGKLLYVGGRKRIRIKNGIAIHSQTVYNDEFISIAEKLQMKFNFSGAWFFQLKYDKNNNLTLLEIATRISGTMSVNRMKGVNFPLLSIYDILGINIDGICENSYEVTVDRALSSKYRLSNINYSNIYIDLDDTIIVKGKINLLIIHFIFQSINEGKRIILLTKTIEDIYSYLKKFRIYELFDEIIRIDRLDSKFKYISSDDSIYIDDSYGERKQMKEALGIPVFDLSNIESLLTDKK